MRVKRLEIHGFKSFKDKTVVHFDHTITGIVGPNGCGKSNIVDAFFWVMGEQSYKHIRGSGSDDLIFNGSAKYNPLGMAEATLVLETGIADTANAPAGATVADVPPAPHKTREISVTRRVYRGGEGEYLINGVPARLRDIQELFMDTGVGAKGYSVIEQGQIGKIVNAKPEERRLLIEEAAGIAKYKARKKESLRKMEATQGNLSRLNDIVVEIERNLASLERQAQKARKYKEYKDQLLDQEMTWGRRKHAVLMARSKALSARRETLQQEQEALKARLQTSENEAEVQRVNQLTDSKELEVLQQAIQFVSNGLTQEESARELSRRRQEDLAQQIVSLEGEQSELSVSIASERQKLSDREAELATARQAFEVAAQKAAAIDEQVRAFRMESDRRRRELEGVKSELMQCVSQGAELTSRVAALGAKAESYQEQLARFAEQEAQIGERLTGLEIECARAKSDLEQAQAAREAQAKIREEAQARIKDRELALELAEDEHSRAQKELTQLQSRLHSLEELAAAFEGLADGPKAALNWAKEDAARTGSSEIFCLAADLFDVDVEAQSALEGWLESRLEQLIATREESAIASTIQAFRHLQKNGLGRASVLARAAGESDVAAHALPDSLLNALQASGLEVLGPLTKFLRVRQELRSVVDVWVDRVCVVRSFDAFAGTDPAAALPDLQGWNLVSLDGWVLQASGNELVLRGGSQKWDRAASLLGRRREIQELGTHVAHTLERVETLGTQAAHLKVELDVERARLESARNEIQSIDVRLAAMQRDLHQGARSLQETQTQHARVRAERERLTADLANVKKEAETAASRSGELAARRAELEQVLNKEDGELGERSLHLRAREAELQEIRVEEASSRERVSSLNRELEVARSFLTARESRSAEVLSILERARRQQNEQAGGDSAILERIEALTLDLSGKQRLLAQVRDRVEQWNASIQAGIELAKQLRQRIDECTTALNQETIEIEKNASEITHLIQNLEEKYGPGCLDRPALVQAEMDAPVVTVEMTAEEERLLSEQVEQLRERIRRLGEVNPMALEEFEETKKRYDHLVSERQDLEHSIQNLQDAIEHINKTSKERFLKAFEAISKRFEQLFPVIFGGGRAQLSLVYPERAVSPPEGGGALEMVAGPDGSMLAQASTAPSAAFDPAQEVDVLEAGVDILAQPPGKKIVNIGLLSGGEKALTAVSLIFAIFMVKPSPFCILDEVDAPLDDANIGRFNALLREMSSNTQFILITHNKKTMELNDTLYGVTMEEPGVSKMLSIEMR